MSNDEEFLVSWDRQVRILTNLASLVTEETKDARPSPDGWTLARHLAHVHEVRYYWLTKVAQSLADTLGDGFQDDGETPIEDLGLLKSELAKSGEAVGTAVRDALANGIGGIGPYSHPIHFLQHMVWHEGWHAGLIALGLRLAGHEPPEAWEEKNVWGVLRS